MPVHRRSGVANRPTKVNLSAWTRRRPWRQSLSIQNNNFAAPYKKMLGNSLKLNENQKGKKEKQRKRKGKKSPAKK